MSAYAVQAEGINISFNGVQVLHNVDFQLKEGEVHSIVGTNGAGKSTLVKILNGVYRRDSGEIRIFGQPVHFNSPDDARKAGIAMVFQDLSLSPTLTVAQNIFLSTHPFRKGIFIDDHKTAQKSAELLAFLGMEEEIDLHKRVEELTTGQKQIVEIAKALANNSKILILDEPTASLSNREVEKLLGVIKVLKGRGISIIFITHSLHDIFRICDRVTVLRDGRVVLVEEVEKLDLKRLVTSMTGTEIDSEKWEKQQDVRTGTPLLELKDVSTSRIRDISLKVFPGEIVGIAGLRGSGRSELLQAIYGLDRLVRGEIYLDNQPVRISSPTQAIEQGIALVPENRREQGLVLDFSVEENMIMPIFQRLTSGLRVSAARSRSIAEKFIDLLDIKTRGPEQVVRYLSGGNQQKVVVAKCLASQARILLLDDPTFGIDVQAKQEIMRIMQDFAAQGNGVILVSSQLEELVDVCASIYIMKQGTITNLVTGEVSKDELLYMIQ